MATDFVERCSHFRNFALATTAAAAAGDDGTTKSFVLLFYYMLIPENGEDLMKPDGKIPQGAH